MSFKRTIKAILPTPLLNAIRTFRVQSADKEYSHLSTQQVFSKIYRQGVWGQSHDPNQPFYSGTGSHNDLIVSTYVRAVREFLSAFAEKPNVVDLGCGDFHVGSQIRPLCGKYVACDIVPQLIEFNKQKYQALDVDFRSLDFIVDELPAGDIVFIRQVLQHLSNEQINRALQKLSTHFKYLVLTEHLPGIPEFAPNLDKPAGPGIRTGLPSGIVLTKAPFNLKPYLERRLCHVAEDGGIIATTLYQLMPN